jgi:cysteine desulfurase / selenocysteine lyase
MSPHNPRDFFPVFSKKQPTQTVVALDNAATTHKPFEVIERLTQFYSHENANIHRGLYTLANTASLAYEDARKTLAHFIHAPSPEQCVFVRGTTEGINLVASGLRRVLLQTGDRIVISEMEHHANILPWQEAALQSGAELDAIPITEEGELDLEKADQLLAKKPKILALAHISNTLGTINPIKELIRKAHAVGCLVLIDGAQAAPHIPINVVDLDCDFYVFSAHKSYGPTGVGLLYGKIKALNLLPPYQYGGMMIEDVSLKKSTYTAPPHRFEAGTPPIADAIAFATAVTFINKHRSCCIAKEHLLFEKLCSELKNCPFITRIGNPQHSAPLLSINMTRVHSHDLATALNQYGICVRAGKHCAYPLFERLARHHPQKSSCRISLALYNNTDDVERLVAALHKIHHFFHKPQKAALI